MDKSKVKSKTLAKENKELRKELEDVRERLRMLGDQKEPELAELMLDNAMFPIMIIGWEDGLVLYANEDAASHLHLTRDEAQGRPVSDFFVSPEDQEALLQLLKNGKDISGIEVEILSNSKKKRQVVLSARRVEFKGVRAVYTVFSDISAWRQVQEDLRESEHRYQKLYNLMKLMADTQPDLLWAKDLNDKFLFVNAAVREKLLMAGDEDPIGKSEEYFAESERKAGYLHTFGEICVDSDEIVKRTQRHGRFLEDGLVRGRYLALDVHKAPMFNEAGELIGTVGAGRNVTRDIATQKALEESEKRFRLLANNIQDVLWISDLDFNPIYVTPSVETLSGYTPEEFLSIPIQLHMQPKYQRKYRALQRIMAKTIKNNRAFTPRFFEFECVKKDRSTVWVEVIASEMRDRKDTLVGFTGMIRDCTKRIYQQGELEAARKNALAASKAKSEFLANMSHELRTPMNGVLGIMQLLKDTPLNSKQKHYVDTALSSGTSLLQIISDILDFSKIEAGRIELVENRFELKTLLNSVMASFQSLLAGEEVLLEVALDAVVPKYIVADEQRLKQILFNLVGNAVKFTPKGSVQIKVQCVDYRGGSQLNLQFVVEDTGAGISSNMVGRLFEPFVQEDGSFRRKYGGTGLGLSIVKNLVEIMGGTINLNSTLGKGTRVEFNIVVKKVEDVAEEAVTVVTQESSRLQKKKILVVEDEKINAMVISAMLEKLGHHVSLATGGIQALKLLEKESYDCIFMDIQMPEMDGVETTRAIRTQLKSTQTKVPIVALTAHAMKGDKERFMEAGMDDYLSKPVEVSRLQEVLKKIDSCVA